MQDPGGTAGPSLLLYCHYLTPSCWTRSSPCPNVKHGDEWGDPGKCENGDTCQYCHTRTEQQFHPEVGLERRGRSDVLYPLSETRRQARACVNTILEDLWVILQYAVSLVMSPPSTLLLVWFLAHLIGEAQIKPNSPAVLGFALLVVLTAY